MNHSQHPSDTVAKVGARAAGAARHTAEQAAHAAEHYAERARHAGDDLQRQADEGVAAARSFVRERPLASLGIALLVGMIAVSLLRR